jgi:lipopolysaccharide/colanic/teichoic acid biosynthesis glycosyltransferase
MDSRGPILFRRTLYGYNNDTIAVFKFRTMALLEDGEQIVPAVQNDSRMTRVGRFLHRTSLDEIPQLINVLRGEMSIVGPRPFHYFHHQLSFGSLVEGSGTRFKPGLTGWAQIQDHGEATDTSEKMQRRVENDLYYINNWSFWFDLRIAIMTVPAVLFGSAGPAKPGAKSGIEN